jgi:hypothetical protein
MRGDTMTRGLTMMRTVGLLVLALWAAAAAGAEARTDHKAYKDSAISDCRDCHVAQGVPDNHGAAFLKEHRLLADKATNNCFDCHQQSYCLDCHQGGNVGDVQKSLSRRGEPMPRTHSADFISVHAVIAKDDPRGCQRCHDSRTFCADCHTRQIQKNRAGMAIKPHAPTFIAGGVPDPAWVSLHKADARRNLQTCQGCHPSKGDCSTSGCHPGLGGR